MIRWKYVRPRRNFASPTICARRDASMLIDGTRTITWFAREIIVYESLKMSRFASKSYDEKVNLL